jgi:6-phosphogluconate dehydrogenase
MAQLADIGLIGLAVMGQNLVLNMNDKGYTVAVYNRTAAKTEEFVAGPAKGRETIIPAYEVADLVASLKRPRRIMLMVKAGAVVDAFIDSLLPHLEAGDIIIDGGNSLFTTANGACGISRSTACTSSAAASPAGRRGAPRAIDHARRCAEAWPAVDRYLPGASPRRSMASPAASGSALRRAGHYVKMVHNGIEYGDMQLIAEAYQVLRCGLGPRRGREMHAHLRRMEQGVLDSYLIEITAEIFAVRDADGTPLLDKVLDAAGQKGTGKWTGINALELGIPLTLISEAVFARSLSALKDAGSRERAAGGCPGTAAGSPRR